MADAILASSTRWRLQGSAIPSSSYCSYCYSRRPTRGHCRARQRRRARHQVNPAASDWRRSSRSHRTPAPRLDVLDVLVGPPPTGRSSLGPGVWAFCPASSHPEKKTNRNSHCDGGKGYIHPGKFLKLILANPITTDLSHRTNRTRHCTSATSHQDTVYHRCLSNGHFLV